MDGCNQDVPRADSLTAYRKLVGGTISESMPQHPQDPKDFLDAPQGE